MAVKKLAPAGGDWNTASTWSPEGVPTAADDVELEVLSKLSTLTLKTTIGKCRSFVVEAGWSGTFVKEKEIEIGTSTAAPANKLLQLVSAMTLTDTSGAWVFVSTTNKEAEPEKIYTGGKTLLNMKLLAKSGVYQFEEAVKLKTEINIAEEGWLKTNGQTVEVLESSINCFNAATKAKLTLGASKIILAGKSAAWKVATTVVLSAAESTIEFTNTEATAKTFTGGGKTGAEKYGVLVVTGNKVQIKESNAFKRIDFKNAGASEGTIFEKGTTQTLTEAPTSNGKAGSLCFVQSSEAGKEWKLTKASGNVNVNFLKIKDSHVDASPKWYAGTGSENVSGNENWLFEAEPSGVTIPLNPAASTSSASGLGLSAATQIPLSAAASSSAASLALTAKTQIPLNAGGSASEASNLGLSAATQIALQAAASMSSASMALTAATQIALQAASSSSSASSLGLSAATTIPLGAASSTSSASTLGLSAATQIPLQPAASSSSATVALTAATQIPLQPASSTSSAPLMEVHSGGVKVPLNAASSSSSATMALTAATQVPLSPASSTSSAAEVTLRARTQVALSPAASESSATMSLSARTYIALNPALSVSGAVATVEVLVAPPSGPLYASGGAPAPQRAAGGREPGSTAEGGAAPGNVASGGAPPILVGR